MRLGVPSSAPYQRSLDTIKSQGRVSNALLKSMETRPMILWLSSSFFHCSVSTSKVVSHPRCFQYFFAGKNNTEEGLFVLIVELLQFSFSVNFHVRISGLEKLVKLCEVGPEPSNKYMLFTRREVRIGKNCAQGLGYSDGTVFPNTDRPSLVNNTFISF